MISIILKEIKRYLINIYRQKQWKARNSNNDTSIGNYYFDNLFDISDVSVGDESFGQIHVISSNSGRKLKIGRYCSIGPNVVFVLNSEHDTKIFSTYPFKVKLFNICKFEAQSKGDIIVDDDVWIGYGATIMSGVHIGQGAVIAAGAVVTKDVQPYSIVGGIPAKLIKFRFSKEIIEELVKRNLSEIKISKQKIDLLYKEMDSFETAKQVINALYEED